MALLCVGYVIAVGTLLAVVGWLVERALPVGAPRRWVWTGTIALSFILPGLYRGVHTAAIDGSLHGGIDPSLAWFLAPAFDRWFTIAWLTVSTGLAAWVALAWWRHGRALRTAVVERIDGVPAHVVEGLGPATIGVFRPRVVLPPWVLGLPPWQRSYVVRHEEEHRRARDSGLLVLAAIPLIVIPWALPLWWQVKRLRLAVELDCDRRVVRRLGRPEAYASLLLRVAEVGWQRPFVQAALLGGGALELRLRALVAPTGVRPGIRAAIAVAVVLLLASLLVAPHPVTATEHAARHPAAPAVGR